MGRSRTTSLLCLLVVSSLVFLAAPHVRSADRLTFSDLKLLLETEKNQDDIVRLVESVERLDLDAAQVKALAKLGAGPDLIQAIRKRLANQSSDLMAGVLSMLAKKRPDGEIVDWILKQGRTRKLSAMEQVKLGRAGASEAVILALEGRYVYPGFRRYKADQGFFAVQCPEDWKVHEWYTPGGYKVILSPERDVSAPNDFTFGVQIQTSTLWPGSPAERVGIYEAHCRSLNALILDNRRFDLKPADGSAGKPRKTEVEGREAVEQVFDTKMRDTACREIMFLTVAEHMEFFVELVAAKADFAKRRDLFEKIERSFRPFPGRVVTPRLDKPVVASDFQDEYLGSLVQIESHFADGRVGFGSGFIVRSDGYILTNHHVVCEKEDHSSCTDPNQMKLATSFTVLWDASVGGKAPGERNRSAPARLVATVYKNHPHVDLALLKIAPADKPYRAIPLTPVGIEHPSGLVKEGDPVVALGFPLPDRFGIGGLIHTRGVLSRISYIHSRFTRRQTTEKLDTLVTELVINPGNSGGPLVDLATGGVIGQTTWDEVAARGEKAIPGTKLGYSASVPIDYALLYFPQLEFYPKKGTLSPGAHVNLAAMFLRQGNVDAAGFELAAASDRETELSPSVRSELYHQLGLWCEKKGEARRALALLEKSVSLDPKNRQALLDLAFEKPSDRPDEAIACIDRYIALQSDDYVGYYERAGFYLAAKRYDEALADLAKAEKRGGGTDPAVLARKGDVLFAKGDLDGGLAAYRASVAADPTYVRGRLGVASYYVRKGNRTAALMEYGRILADEPDDAEAQEAFGRYLVSLKGQEKDGLSHLTRAVLLSIDAGKPPPPLLLRDVSTYAREVPGAMPDALASAQILYREWPRFRDTAMLELGRCWKDLGEKALAAVHFERAERYAGASAKVIASAPHVLLSLSDLDAMVTHGYESDLMSDVLSETNLDFVVNAAEIRQVTRAGWQKWQIFQMLNRFLSDERRGGPALGSLVTVAYVGNVHTSSATGPSSTIRLSNRGRMPLTGFVAEFTYYHKVGKRYDVLWRTTAPLMVPFGVLLPGETRQLLFNWHSWAQLKAAGVDVGKITSYGLRIVSARNADYLSQVKVVGGYTKDHKAYRFTLVNDSPFTLTGFVLRCDFLGKNGAPVVRPGAGPIYDTARLSKIDLAPGKKSSAYDVARWSDWTYLRKIGVNASAVKVHVTVVNASFAHS